MQTLKTCQACGERVFKTESTVPTAKHEKFEIKYSCPNGHRGKVTGFVGESPGQWRKTGAIHDPTERRDVNV